MLQLAHVIIIVATCTCVVFALTQGAEESRRNPNRKRADTICLNCEENSCDNNTGLCDQCLRGFYGEKCEDTCPNTCPECDQYTGQCVSCRDGWFGPHCFFKCVLCFSCHIVTGECTSCKPKKWGPFCQQDCDRNCYICQTQNGKCVQCAPGYYGRSCEKRCTNCFRGLCRPRTGVCHFGCKAGFYGKFCQSHCPSNCRLCDKNNGKCIQKRPEFARKVQQPEIRTNKLSLQTSITIEKENQSSSQSQVSKPETTPKSPIKVSKTRKENVFKKDGQKSPSKISGTQSEAKLPTTTIANVEISSTVSINETESNL
ncbi:multiple epidermal growth factor-like domains protein 10 [Saccostrea echinata]|uniref:multiple epidermal growth factor-like domains protein 10 n=1 Tax=Saccostrea echinata TaxID=191078 RepID=UPI002A802584|nr:multiple epidermal growth factor-like domains protein 10 [Saccostrea echinata]